MFGMGTGGPSPLKTPTVNGYCQILTDLKQVVKGDFACALKTEQRGDEVEKEGCLHNVGQALG